jgi:hypothetical protein
MLTLKRSHLNVSSICRASSEGPLSRRTRRTPECETANCCTPGCWCPPCITRNTIYTVNFNINMQHHMVAHSICFGVFFKASYKMIHFCGTQYKHYLRIPKCNIKSTSDAFLHLHIQVLHHMIHFGLWMSFAIFLKAYICCSYVHFQN